MTSISVRLKTTTQEPAVNARESVFRFLDLPAEIRNLIYHHLFSGLRLDLLDYSVLRGHGPKYFDCGVLGVNRRLRKEVLPIFYRLTSFVMRISDLDDYQCWTGFSSANNRRQREHRQMCERMQNIFFHRMAFLSRLDASEDPRQSWEQLKGHLSKLPSLKKITFQTLYRLGAVTRWMSPESEVCFAEYKQQRTVKDINDTEDLDEFEDAILTVDHLAPLTLHCINLMKNAPQYETAVIWKEIGYCGTGSSNTITIITQNGFKVSGGTEAGNRLWKMALRKRLGFEELIPTKRRG